MIVLPETENVFESEWVIESLAACEGERKPYDPHQRGGFGFGRFGFGD
jgi:hypothetical protein